MFYITISVCFYDAAAFPINNKVHNKKQSKDVDHIGTTDNLDGKH